MSENLVTLSEENKFKKVMYPIIKNISNNIIIYYDNIIKNTVSNNEHIKMIFAYFICGPHYNGLQFKPTNNNNEMKTYDYCELGITLCAIKDRLYHIGRVANVRANSTKYNKDKEIYLMLANFSTDFKKNVEKYSIEWLNKINKIKELTHLT